MEKKAPEAPARTMPYEEALTLVVKGLYHDPVLLFGIGAGIVVVGALAFTSSVVLVLIVAALFVVVLAARAHQRAQRVQREGPDVLVRSFGLGVGEGARVGTAPAGLPSRVRGFFLFTRVGKNARVGTVGDSDPPDRPEP